MVDAWLSYGKTEVCVRVPTRSYLGSIEPKEKDGVPDADAEIARALREPIGSRKLGEIVKPNSKVAIVIDDATRAVPSGLMVRQLLSELNVAGIGDDDVTVIFACGSHRAVKQEEAVSILDETILGRVNVISHDCKAQDLVYVGSTKTHATKVYLNRVFAEADVRILAGDVGFHYYAGYGGGRKSVVPGVSGEETITHNHALLLNANACAGVLAGNPVHEDMVEAARLAKVDFVLNVVTNSGGAVVRAFAGDLEQTFNEGAKLVDEMYRVAVDRRADIVVVSCGGHPADLNLFQAFKAVDNALQVTKRGGIIILVAECPEGYGNQVFYDWMTKFTDARSAEREIKHNFVFGGHRAYYHLKALQHHQIFLVSSLPDYYAVNVFQLKTARAVNDALNESFNVAGRNARVWVMPFGNYTLPEIKGAAEQEQPQAETLQTVS